MRPNHHNGTDIEDGKHDIHGCRCAEGEIITCSGIAATSVRALSLVRTKLVPSGSGAFGSVGLYKLYEVIDVGSRPEAGVRSPFSRVNHPG